MYEYNFPVRNDFFGLEQIVGVDVELTSKLLSSSDAPASASLSLSTLGKLLAEMGEQIKYIGLVSHYGDPSAHSNLLEAVDLIQKTSGAYLKISTYGYCQPTSVWEALGRRLPADRGSVVFNIDGLKDTLGISRPGVEWDTVLQNAGEFIAAGGNAVWNWFPYQHTDHQIDEAQRLAESLGFAAILLNRSPRRASFKNADGIEVKHSKVLFHTRYERQELAKKEGRTATKFPISCRAKRRRTFYLTASGHIHPCHRLDGSNPSSHFSQIIESYGRDLFDLNLHTVREIFDGAWFARDMKYSIKILPNCYKNCELFSKVTPRENQTCHIFKPYEDREPTEGVCTWDVPYADSAEPWEIKA